MRKGFTFAQWAVALMLFLVFGTLSQEMVLFSTQNRIEGMWLQIRRISLGAWLFSQH